MTRSITLSAVLCLAALTGCQSQHQQKKEALVKDFEAARAQLNIDMAKQQFEAGDFGKAQASCQKIITACPDYAPTYVLLGRIYLEHDEPGKARDILNRALEIDSRSASANYYLAVIHERWKKLNLAQEYYQAAWDIDPRKPSYLLGIVGVQVALGRPEQALDLLLEHKDQLDYDPALCLTAGNILTALGRYDQAVDMFVEASDVSPENWGIKESLAFALHRAGRPVEALSAFDELIKKRQTQKEDVPLAYYLATGDCYLAVEEYHLAQRAFETVTTAQRNDDQAWLRLAQAYLAGQKLGQAKAAADRALAIKKQNPDALIVLAYVAIKQQDHDRAAQYLQQVIQLQPQHALAYCLLGQCAQQNDQPEKARAYYQQALDIDPDDNLARRLLASLAGPVTPETTRLVPDRADS